MDTKNVLVAGATGLIGSALCSALTDAGYTVHKLQRESSDAPFHYFESSGVLALDAAIPLYAVINLAGPNIGDKRWSKNRKEYLLNSRVRLTNALSTAIAQLATKPKLFLSASAIGYYGASSEGFIDEHSPAGNDFLAEIGQKWEQATSPAEQAGINTIHLRIGIVLSKHGGMLKKLLLPFKLGLGGRIGDGRQYLSWISIFDVLQTILFLLEKNPKAGPLNLVADEAISNADFSTQLGLALNRPSLLPMPKFMVKMLFGEMGDALLLGSSNIKSTKLESLGIKLEYPLLGAALKATLQE